MKSDKPLLKKNKIIIHPLFKKINNEQIQSSVPFLLNKNLPNNKLYYFLGSIIFISYLFLPFWFYIFEPLSLKIKKWINI